MPRPFLILSKSDYLIRIVDINSHTLMANSVNSDQLASSEASWYESTLFAKAGHIRVQKDYGLAVGKLFYSQFIPVSILTTFRPNCSIARNGYIVYEYHLTKINVPPFSKRSNIEEKWKHFKKITHKIVLPPFKEVVYSKRKEIVLRGSKFFAF